MRSTLLLICGLCIGCGPDPLHLVDTKLHPNGSVDRAIVQHSHSVPDDALHSNLWQQSGTLKGRPTIELEDLQTVEFSTTPPKDVQQHYFAAWNHFKSPAEIPAHLSFGPKEGQQTQLRREYRRRDYGLIVEHLWTEELPNTITLADALVARQEFAERVCKQAEFVLREGWRDYDSDELLNWLRTDGTRWFEQLAEAQIEARLPYKRRQERDDTWQEMKSWMAPICAQRGLKLHNTGSENEVELKRFVTNLLQKKLRRRDGQPIDSAQIDILFNSLKDLFDTAEDGDWPPETRALRAAQKKYAEEHPDAPNLYSKLVDRIWGLAGPLGIGFAPHGEFSFRLTMPGALISSNGLLQGGGKMIWQFNSSELFPLGVSMFARSIERREFPVQEVHPSVLKLSPERLVVLADLVGPNEKLMTALQDCRKAKSLKPLDQFIEQHIPAVTDDPKSNEVSEDNSHYLQAIKVKHWLKTGIKQAPK